jgi:hypothetical protein
VILYNQSCLYNLTVNYFFWVELGTLGGIGAGKVILGSGGQVGMVTGEAWEGFLRGVGVGFWGVGRSQWEDFGFELIWGVFGGRGWLGSAWGLFLEGNVEYSAKICYCLSVRHPVDDLGLRLGV